MAFAPRRPLFGVPSRSISAGRAPPGRRGPSRSPPQPARRSRSRAEDTPLPPRRRRRRAARPPRTLACRRARGNRGAPRGARFLEDVDLDGGLPRRSRIWRAWTLSILLTLPPPVVCTRRPPGAGRGSGSSRVHDPLHRSQQDVGGLILIAGVGRALPHLLAYSVAGSVSGMSPKMAPCARPRA